MTKTQLKRKVKELIKENNKMIEEKLEKLLKSGAINLPDYEDNYVLPKIFMCAIGKEMQFQWKPYNQEDRKTVENVSNFL